MPGLFDMLQIGGELLGGFAEAADIHKTLKEYPNDAPVFNNLLLLFNSKGLETIKVPEKLTLVSRKQLRGLTFKDFGCIANINSGTGVSLLFTPMEKLDRSRGSQAFELGSKINSMLQVGCIEVRPIDINDELYWSFVYKIQMRYGENLRPGKALLENMLENGLDSMNYLPHGIQVLQKGSSVDEALQNMGGKSVLPKKPSSEQRASLLGAVSRFLTNKDIDFVELDESKGFTWIDKATSLTCSILVSQFSRVTFETLASVKIPSKFHLQVLLYNQFVNLELTDMGCMCFSTETGIVSYKTGVDVRGIEDNVEDRLLSIAYEENRDQVAKYFPGLGYISSGSSYSDALKKSIQSQFNTPEYQEFADAIVEFLNLK
ncbi:MAG TPA: hypothetical protein PKK96_13100 [Anaerolineales bacterium]|nr:hypothetical protein [Anaerolineales bacterium]HNQ94804.1 hypothetical protein [Anaerolineales bacterium]HNS61938.1 hypothetical protein [Anaerolineales bacterium]